MTSAQLQNTFGQQKRPHTVIIARGEKVRHFTVSARLVEHLTADNAVELGAEGCDPLLIGLLEL
ncbi:MAG: hypothetical protein EOP94_03450, partial [Zymomonas sp.]